MITRQLNEADKAPNKPAAGKAGIARPLQSIIIAPACLSRVVLREERRAPMSEHLYYFRPGEAARMLARCQFGLEPDGRCGASMTYPIKGYPWRHNPVCSYEFHLSPKEALELFDEVKTMQARFPEDCLGNDVLWSDTSEKANGITRHVKTGKLCHTLGVFQAPGVAVVCFSMEEDSVALCSSRLYTTVAKWIAPYETLPLTSAEPNASPNGGPAEPLGNLDVSGGPPSVS